MVSSRSTPNTNPNPITLTLTLITPKLFSKEEHTRRVYNRVSASASITYEGECTAYLCIFSWEVPIPPVLIATLASKRNVSDDVLLFTEEA